MPRAGSEYEIILRIGHHGPDASDMIANTNPRLSGRTVADDIDHFERVAIEQAEPHAAAIVRIRHSETCPFRKPHDVVFIVERHDKSLENAMPILPARSVRVKLPAF